MQNSALERARRKGVENEHVAVNFEDPNVLHFNCSFFEATHANRLDFLNRNRSLSEGPPIDRPPHEAGDNSLNIHETDPPVRC